MKLVNEKVRSEKLYTVGYDKENNRYLLSAVVTWICWYNRYYLISKEEYELFDTNIEVLDLIAEECKRTNTRGKRFVYSDKIEENS